MMAAYWDNEQTGHETMQKASKVISLVDAVASIPSGVSVSFSGFGHAGHPMALVRELIRQGRRELTLNAIAECWPAEFLVGAGSVSSINMSNLMFEGLGRCRAISTAIERGEVRVDDHSHLALSLRLLASGWGVPFLPTRSLAGTDLENIQTGERPKYARIDSPFGDGQVGVVSALRSDVAVIHVNKCDDQGNGVVYGTISVIDAQIRSADRVIVTTEQLVPADQIVAENQSVVVPGFLVDAIAHTPFGSHPGGMYRLYDEDLEHMIEYYEASRDAKTLAAYHAQFVHGTRSHEDYLAKLGSRRLFSLLVDPELRYAVRAGG